MIVTPEFAGLDGREAPPEPVDRTVSPSDGGGVKGHYEEYCRQQVTLLLEIIPREDGEAALPSREDLGDRAAASRHQGSDVNPTRFLP